jgi:hypothetical protein
MCQFLSLPLFNIPQVSKFDVIMRLDSDSFIHGAAQARCSCCCPLNDVAGQVRSDPFKEFVSRHCLYGYVAVGQDHARMLRGLHEAIHDFMGRSSQPLQSWFRRRFLDKQGLYQGDFFYNNFEMCVGPQATASRRIFLLLPGCE